ncbi:MAG: glycosyltransferase [Candidatus Latescibacteria bacterium]|nr:glycosyltransferase [Candidatus Latescibacterota bacterium]NIM21059.1 glycosyltransferase [Candidatus Latescibacterota bacterium]NIM65194.1 glycosyltransferase [Candidatus Latescibacterota bacterium]NIO01709.1 glycosyltransferase [Candidatus Latescibacterota bacterium]NIO28226.1 glycosyltransferase [Candidatus Latescibacterota bacterium]
MKIAVVTQSYYPRPGGVTEHAHHTALELRKRGHTVSIFTANFGSDPHADPGVLRFGRNVLVPHHGAWVNMTVGMRLGRQLRDALREFDPNIVHTHCPLVPTLPLFAIHTAPSNAAIVGTFHAAAETSPGYSLFRRPLAKFAERIHTRIAVSEAARCLAQKYFPGRYEVLPNGIDCQRFAPRIEPFERFQDDAFNVLFVGRMDRRKGLKYLFSAISIVANATSKRVRLIVVGENSLRRYLLPRLDRKVELHFAGIVSRDILPRYYASCDIFCSPAVEKESFGIVLLEAMASGVPVVGTSIPGYLSLLEHGQNALVVPPRDPQSFADAIIHLLEDDLLRLKLRKRGIEFAGQFRWDLITARLEQLYRDTLSQGRAEIPIEETYKSANLTV